MSLVASTPAPSQMSVLTWDPFRRQLIDSKVRIWTWSGRERVVTGALCLPPYNGLCSWGQMSFCPVFLCWLSWELYFCPCTPCWWLHPSVPPTTQRSFRSDRVTYSLPLRASLG